jgi:hypothetical protein
MTAEVNQPQTGELVSEDKPKLIDAEANKKLSERLLPDSAQAIQATHLTLQFGSAPTGFSQTHVVYLASGDTGWRKLALEWLPSVDNPRPVDAFPATMGMLIRLHHPVPLSLVSNFVARLQKAYQETVGRNMGRDAHIFLAEQIACEYERTAINALSYRERGLVRPWLQHSTVDILEKPAAVELFLKAWCAGLVQPAFGSGDYLLRLEPGAEPLWSTGDCEHPLDALRAYTSQDPARLRVIERSLQEKFHSNEMMTPDDRLPAIANWSQAGKIAILAEWKINDTQDLLEHQRSQKNYDWYILVNGLPRRKQA